MYGKKKIKVVIALSGGVDSSVAALILKEKGYEIIGLFMNNWEENNSPLKCSWNEDSIHAMIVANKLNIPFQVIEMKNEYEKYILNYMFNEYKSGNTPNPDILCNKKIKFNLFLNIANRLGADYISTGHYVQKKEISIKNKKINCLLTGKDSNKDQSYFLCQLNQYQINKSIFPIGKLTKNQVRDIAKKNNLINALKKESQGLCFVGKIKLSEFLEKKIPKKKGKIIFIDYNSNFYKNKKKINFFTKKKYKKSDGKFIGYHNGAHFFTRGQRKGISIGGYKKALFVIDTDVKENIIYTGMGKDHPGLYNKFLFIKNKDIHWIREDLTLLNGEKMNVYSRIRYRQPLQKSILHKLKEGMLVKFEKMQYSITPGQFIAWYIENELIGSGVIYN